MIDQHHLETLIRQRIRDAGHILDAKDDLAAFEANLSLPKQGADAFVVLRAFDLPRFVRGAFNFVVNLDQEQRQSWISRFTLTTFLAGDPHKLSDFPWLHQSQDGTIGWLLLREPKQKKRLMRLLKRLKTNRAVSLPKQISIALNGTESQTESPALDARLVSEGLHLESYLIHAHHLICEAALRGQFSASEILRIQHVSQLDTWTEPPIMTRIHRDPAEPDRLKVYGCLFRSP